MRHYTIGHFCVEQPSNGLFSLKIPVPRNPKNVEHTPRMAFFVGERTSLVENNPQP